MLLCCNLIHRSMQVEPPPIWRDATQVLVQAERKPVDTSGWSDFKDLHRNPHAKRSSLPVTAARGCLATAGVAGESGQLAL